LARKILLADDSVTAQNMGRKILADAGYEVITVNNGSAALKRISETKPDLIVLDVYMPGYSGLEVCQRLKESGDTARIPIVLTVGKLEPFKPEEAKRVRADGFIVKPFEASELLSALSKLEDRIVPRPEPAKPGRFARANAALDAAYDKSAAGTEEDSGWKSRISFPAKKKAAEPEEADDSSIYNPVNKDLRTVVEPKKAAKAQEAPEKTVDLGALAPEGMPKDVTPEEIAALAAAAAQVKGKISEGDAAPEAPKPAVESNVIEAKASEIKTEDKVASNVEPLPVPEPQKETVAAVAQPASPPETKAIEMPAEAPAIAASAELKPVAAISSSANSGNGSGTREHDEPVTMAVAAGAEYSAIPAARWKAIPVAVLAEEAALSLEEEMRKALSVVAAAEMAQSASVTTLASAAPEATPVAVSEVVPPVAATAAEPIASVPSEAAATLSAVANVAADAISEAVKDLEAAAASYPEFHKPVPPPVESEPVAAATAQSVPAPEKVEAPVTAVAQVEAVEPSPKAEITQIPPAEAKDDQKVTEAKVEELKAEERTAEARSDAAKFEDVKAPEARVTETKAEELKEEPKFETAKLEEPKAEEKIEAAKVEESQTPVRADAASATQVPEAAAKSEVAPQAAPETVTEIAQEQATAPSSHDAADEPAKLAAAYKSVFGGIDDMAKKETEMAEHTAAAWASWRRIRDDGKGGSAKDGSAKEGSSKESKTQSGEISTDDAKAAMAVAAGAEKAPEDAVAHGEDSEVSAIVDSVLAEMRPRIVEEISRKLGKKK
jgi:CheY-like chemotaxis protein